MSLLIMFVAFSGHTASAMELSVVRHQPCPFEPLYQEARVDVIRYLKEEREFEARLDGYCARTAQEESQDEGEALLVRLKALQSRAASEVVKLDKDLKDLDIIGQNLQVISLRLKLEEEAKNAKNYKPYKVAGVVIGAGALAWCAYRWHTGQFLLPDFLNNSISSPSLSTSPSPSLARSIVPAPTPAEITALNQKAYDSIHSSLRQQLTRHKHSLLYCFNHGFLNNQYVDASQLRDWIIQTGKMKKHWEYGK